MTPPDILPRLRAATAPAHQRLETGLGLLDPCLDRPRYTAIIAGFYGFWRGWQPEVRRILADDAFTTPRRRLPALVADLAALGLAPDEIANLPTCRPPPLPNAAAALGSLYVLEGSTLGGRVILKTVAPRLGLSATAGCAYFAGYGTATGLMWQQFLACLAAAPAADHNAILAGAATTFETLTTWLTAAAPRPRVAADA